MFRDPIVEEVRAIREQLAAQFGFDLRKIVEDAQRRQAASKGRIVSFHSPIKATQPTGSSLPLSRDVTPLEAAPTEEL